MSDTAYGTPEELSKAIRITLKDVRGAGGQVLSDAQRESLFNHIHAELNSQAEAWMRTNPAKLSDGAVYTFYSGKDGTSIQTQLDDFLDGMNSQ